MAIIENPMIGKARKKLGNTIFYTQWGKNILRSKPLEVKNPRTPAQQANRGRFKKLTLLLRMVNDNINEAYAGSTLNMSAQAYLISINNRKCWIDDTPAIDPGLFILCDHNGSFVGNVALTSALSDTITGTFNSNAQNAGEENDPIKAYGFYPDGNQIWQFSQTATRSTGKITLARPGIAGLNIAVYLECLDRVTLIDGNPMHVIKYVGTVAVI